jgi:hypothetical protein
VVLRNVLLVLKLGLLKTKAHQKVKPNRSANASAKVTVHSLKVKSATWSTAEGEFKECRVTKRYYTSSEVSLWWH